MAMRGGCVLQGCLVVLGGALALVLGGMVWLGTASGRDEGKARDSMKRSVDAARIRLAQAAADGTLLGTEIDRAVSPLNRSNAQVRRAGQQVTVTQQFRGLGPGFMAATEVSGCYRFDIEPPSVTAHEISEKVCRDRPILPYRPTADVAADVVTELRSALSAGDLMAAQNAEVWRTYGINVAGQETKGEQLVVLAMLLRKPGAPLERDCYEFRVREHPRSVSARKLKPDGCSRIEREREARDKADRRAELDASARKIEGRIERAADDGTLSDTELKRALALPRTDSMGLPAPRDPVAAAVTTRRSASEVVVLAKVSALDETHWNDGCYEFRAHLATQSVTHRATGTDCLYPAR
ncbi:hypothetical protein [Streptomyces sp. NPDC005485]|uniref:hypothetical protein n=1 Tax=Streptomyces sp. NPDC005485 TaxID=3155591 RepID=UPI0033BD916F